MKLESLLISSSFMVVGHSIKYVQVILPDDMVDAASTSARTIDITTCLFLNISVHMRQKASTNTTIAAGRQANMYLSPVSPRPYRSAIYAAARQVISTLHTSDNVTKLNVLKNVRIPFFILPQSFMNHASFRKRNAIKAATIMSTNIAHEMYIPM